VLGMWPVEEKDDDGAERWSMEVRSKGVKQRHLCVPCRGESSPPSHGALECRFC
jgi:hypothetical protein